MSNAEIDARLAVGNIDLPIGICFAVKMNYRLTLIKLLKNGLNPDEIDEVEDDDSEIVDADRERNRITLLGERNRQALVGDDRKRTMTALVC